MSKEPAYYFDRFIDLLLFRESLEDDNFTNQPTVTSGSIIWGIILRTSLILGVFFLLIIFFNIPFNWWFILFLLWLLVAYPAYKQFQSFDSRIERLNDSILCGSCRYYNSDAQLCKIYDEHVSINHLPCNGESWEPKPYEEEN